MHSFRLSDTALVLSDICAVQAMYRTDMWLSGAEKSEWKKMEKKCCIWKSAGGDIGWEIKDHKIIRSEGKFDEYQNCWIERKQALLLQQIDEADFSYYFDHHERFCAGILEIRSSRRQRIYIVIGSCKRRLFNHE